MLVDKEIGLALPCKAHHSVVEVLDPSANDFTIAQLDRDQHLSLAEGAQIESLLSGFTRRRCLGTTAGR